MLHINADNMGFEPLNECINNADDESICIDNCRGQRYIGSGLRGRSIQINGTPGNALGAYLDGSRIEVVGNAQDATGDTMNDGEIVVRGFCGDATGYAMRGGRIYVRDNAGYRAGIHMKQYGGRMPVLVIGGAAGSFLGEYQAGGMIIVLGLGVEGRAPVGHFCGTGMHGGKIYLRTDVLRDDFPPQVSVTLATEADMADIEPYINAYCTHFSQNIQEIYKKSFYVLRPNTKNPYKQLYTVNRM